MYKNHVYQKIDIGNFQPQFSAEEPIESPATFRPSLVSRTDNPLTAGRT